MPLGPLLAQERPLGQALGSGQKEAEVLDDSPLSSNGNLPGAGGKKLVHSRILGRPKRGHGLAAHWGLRTIVLQPPRIPATLWRLRFFWAELVCRVAFL